MYSVPFDWDTILVFYCRNWICPFYGDPVTKKEYTFGNVSDISGAVPAYNEHSKIQKSIFD